MRKRRFRQQARPGFSQNAASRVAEIGWLLLLSYTKRVEIEATQAFTDWIDGLKDLRARTRILRRIERLGAGNPGEHRNLDCDISELKIREGKGYRVYYTYRNLQLILLLCGGGKASKTGQQRDIARAQAMADDLYGD